MFTSCALSVPGVFESPRFVPLRQSKQNWAVYKRALCTSFVTTLITAFYAAKWWVFKE